MLELFHYDFFQNALLSTLFIGISCGLVGTYIVARRMVFISGGITHASFGGLGLSFYLGLPPMLGATCFALLSALGIQCLGARRKISEDSLIGIFWSAGMAIGILFIYLTPGYAPDLMSYLFGNILTVTPAQLILSAVLCGLILLFFALFSRPLFYIAFDREYSQTHHVRGGTLDTAATVIIALCQARRHHPHHLLPHHPADHCRPVLPQLPATPRRLSPHQRARLRRRAARRRRPRDTHRGNHRRLLPRAPRIGMVWKGNDRKLKHLQKNTGKIKIFAGEKNSAYICAPFWIKVY